MSRETLNSIASALGAEYVLLLSKHFRGSWVHIPHTPREGSELVRALGLERAEALAKYMGGENIEVPFFCVNPITDQNLLEERNKRIVARVEAGEKKTTVARDMGLTLRMVRNILNQA